MFWSIVTVLGLATLANLLFKLVSFAFTQSRTFNPKAYGEWAVVTGATDGIGRAFCDAFAKAGMNVVCISRTQSKLDACVQELEATHKVKAISIAADFNRADADALYATIEQKLKNLEVGVLVNNVGASYDHAQYFHVLDQEKIDSLIRMNVVSTTRMSHMVLSQMVDRKKGSIINIGSAHGSMRVGAPLYAVYSATNAYVDLFSRSLDTEYASKGINVQCQIPYFVSTKLAKIRKASLTVPNPASYVASAMKCIGSGSVAVPVPIHAFQHFLINCVIPPFVASKVVLAMHVSILKRALKKKAQKKE